MAVVSGAGVWEKVGSDARDSKGGGRGSLANPRIPATVAERMGCGEGMISSTLKTGSNSIVVPCATLLLPMPPGSSVFARCMLWCIMGRICRADAGRSMSVSMGDCGRDTEL